VVPIFAKYVVNVHQSCISKYNHFLSLGQGKTTLEQPLKHSLHRTSTSCWWSTEL